MILQINQKTIMKEEKKEFVITRIFHAPRELVWKAWTEPRSLKEWWGPKGFKIRVFKFELKPNGIFHYSMQSEDTPTLWGKFVFREIDAPERLVYINSFSDEDGNIIRPPFDQTWPKKISNTVTFTEKDSKTKLILRSWPVNATDEEYKTFDDNFASMNEGFGGTFDQLDEHLAVAHTNNPDSK